MRVLLRAGVTTLAAGALLLGGAVAASAAAAGTVTVTVNRLILEPGRYGHTGSIRATIHNGTAEPFTGSITITEAIPDTTGAIQGGGGCLLSHTPDDRTVTVCPLDSTIAPGGTSVVTVGFQSPARPEPFARIAPLRGSVEVGGATADFPALFRSTTGSLRHPRPYVQDTTAALAVTAGDVTLTRQPDGTFAGRVPVTVRNNGDAPHTDLHAAVATPAGVDDWPFIDPPEVCGPSDELPVPPGGHGTGCMVAGGQLAEGQTRTFDWLLTAPAGTPPGVLGTGTTATGLIGPAAAQTNAANIDTFTVTVAG